MLEDFHDFRDGGTPFLDSVGQWNSAIKDSFLGKMLLSNDFEGALFICGCKAPDAEPDVFFCALLSMQSTRFAV